MEPLSTTHYRVINSTYISATTVDVSSSVTSGKNGTIGVNIDGNEFLSDVQFVYVEPTFIGLFDNISVAQAEGLVQG